MKDKSKLMAIILVIVTIIVLIISYLYPNKKEEETTNDVYIVKNYSNFYTVNSCLYRVITYLYSQNKKDMIFVLNEDYKNKNKVTEDNVLSLFPKIEQGSTFVSTKMYYENVTDSITKYYVQGHTEREQLVENGNLLNIEKNNIYFIVYLDIDNKIFSIEPYSGDIFMDGESNE